jgi:hypothetical protein
MSEFTFTMPWIVGILIVWLIFMVGYVAGWADRGRKERR